MCVSERVCVCNHACTCVCVLPLQSLSRGLQEALDVGRGLPEQSARSRKLRHAGGPPHLGGTSSPVERARHMTSLESCIIIYKCIIHQQHAAL